MVRLNPLDQNVFSAFQNGQVFYPVPNKWGQQGATLVNLNLVTEEMLADALNCAYTDLIQRSTRKK